MMPRRTVRLDLNPRALQKLGLSRREAEVLHWVAQGKTNKDIGSILGISDRTVQNHLERIYKKFRVWNRMEAVMTALQRLHC